MPRGHGTGPVGGKRSDRDQGLGGGQIQGAGRGKTGGIGLGIGGDCICPQCRTMAPREWGKPCLQQKCPQCGSTMVRA